ncbi:MAG: ATP-binding protein [Acholeplasmatales bacterium]
MKYIKRINESLLEQYLSIFKGVLIVGPKFSGKTTLAKVYSKSEITLTPLNMEDYKTMLNLNPNVFFKGEKPKLIDEWQLIPEVWDLVRHQVDKEVGRGLYLLTGSSSANFDLNVHSGAGRIGRMIIRPMSLYEVGASNGLVSIKELFEGKNYNYTKSSLNVNDYALWIIKGGWPLGVYDTEEQAIIRNNAYLDAIVKEDVNKVSNKKYNELRMLKVIESLARFTASETTNTAIINDLKSLDEGMAVNTLLDYLNVLNKIYIIEDLKAWNPNLRSKTVIRSTPARFFVDPSIGAAALKLTTKRLNSDFKTFGLFFESLVLRDVRIYAETIGGKVYRYKDSTNLEVDIILELKDGRWGAIEVKMGSNEFDSAAEKLLRFSANIDESKMGKASFLAIISATEYAYKREDGVYVIPLGTLKN